MTLIVVSSTVLRLRYWNSSYIIKLNNYLFQNTSFCFVQIAYFIFISPCQYPDNFISFQFCSGRYIVIVHWWKHLWNPYNVSLHINNVHHHCYFGKIHQQDFDRLEMNKKYGIDMNIYIFTCIDVYIKGCKVVNPTLHYIG